MLGVKELDEDVEDGGRGMPEAAAEAVLVVFTNLVGRLGDVLLLEGVASFALEGVVGGVALIALDRLAFNAARWGRGLMGRDVFSDGERMVSPLAGTRLSSFSSSELISGLRVPVRGEGGLATSINVDFGRYFGRADEAAAVLGRSVDTLVALPESSGLGDCSSMDALCNPADTRRRVTVFDSGVPTRFVWECAVTSPIEARGAAGFEPMALRRRELVSFALRTLLSESLLSLFMTSANALPASPKECRIELLVDGLVRGLPLEPASEG